MQLNMRGYADSEIEAVFSKYDVNGDRLLDENELRKMQNDLESQKFDFPSGVLSDHGLIQISINEQMAKGSDKEEGYESDGEKGEIDANSEVFALLRRRVDRMEHAIGSIVSKIDCVLDKLEAIEIAKAKRRENIGLLIDNIAASGSGSQDAQQQMEKIVKDEMTKWDKEHFAPKSMF
ncbi:hypothetical protein HELRODRAFT_171405 [Helobdella robusta]|uniref:EF-hand domain-containing protein n=1 Tax=Helobdella robusta TaxID=6412 RepID=T1F485_HELRO|nr:hypothetical protein HELRODRAFT_171405 [Helobdella robusta]ESO05738.1 hypothetical protein HELRODRAFT_171405 [Helobdella robusta]